MGFRHVTFSVVAAIFRTLRCLSLVIGNRNNTSPTMVNNGILKKRKEKKIDTLGLDPDLLSSELLTLLKSSENVC